LDSEWHVYGFKRDGVEYYQVNDLAGRVQLIIGTVDGMFWALPAGEKRSQLILPSQDSLELQSGERSIVYQSHVFSIVLYRSGNESVWSVE